MEGVLLLLTPWPNIGQTRVPFFSICLANRCCEMMFWRTIHTMIWRAPMLVCSSQKLIILTLGSGVLGTSCWLLQAVSPPKCQMLLCLLSDLICHLHPPWGPVSHNQTTAGLSTPSPAPGGLSQQLYGTHAHHCCPCWVVASFECRMSALMWDGGAFPCWVSMSMAASWRNTSFLSVVLSKPLFLSE